MFSFDPRNMVIGDHSTKPAPCYDDEFQVASEFTSLVPGDDLRE